jgi:hypothetical protein
MALIHVSYGIHPILSTTQIGLVWCGLGGLIISAESPRLMTTDNKLRVFFEAWSPLSPYCTASSCCNRTRYCRKFHINAADASEAEAAEHVLQVDYSSIPAPIPLRVLGNLAFCDSYPELFSSVTLCRCLMDSSLSSGFSVVASWGSFPRSAKMEVLTDAQALAQARGMGCSFVCLRCPVQIISTYAFIL